MLHRIMGKKEGNKAERNSPDFVEINQIRDERKIALSGKVGEPAIDFLIEKLTLSKGPLAGKDLPSGVILYFVIDPDD